MIKVFTAPSCGSSRKAKKWLEKFNLDYREVNLFVQGLKKDDIYSILSKTENGVEDIISKRSKIIQSGIDVDDMSVSELVEFLKENPSAMRRPIIMDDDRLQIGYNEEDIRVFVPKEYRESHSFSFSNS